MKKISLLLVLVLLAVAACDDSGENVQPPPPAIPNLTACVQGNGDVYRLTTSARNRTGLVDTGSVTLSGEVTIEGNNLSINAAPAAGLTGFGGTTPSATTLPAPNVNSVHISATLNSTHTVVETVTMTVNNQPVEAEVVDCRLFGISPLQCDGPEDCAGTPTTPECRGGSCRCTASSCTGAAPHCTSAGSCAICTSNEHCGNATPACVAGGCVACEVAGANCPPTACNTSSCPAGCCGTTGTCVTSLSAARCGTSGFGTSCVACSSGQNCTGGVCVSGTSSFPTPSLVRPSPSTACVPMVSNVEVSFNRNMNASSITVGTPSSGTFFVLSRAGDLTSAIAGTVSCNTPCTVATFRPSARFVPANAYTVVLEPTISDTNGTALNRQYTWFFTTPAAGCNECTCPNGCCQGSTCNYWSLQSHDSCGNSPASSPPALPRFGGACHACSPSEVCSRGRCVTGTSSGACNATTCATGCCVGTTCWPGDTFEYCGYGGEACEICIAGETCNRAVPPYRYPFADCVREQDRY